MRMQKFKSVLLLLAFIVLAACAPTKSSPKLYGGHTYSECVISWEHVKDGRASAAKKTNLVQMILNSTWPPDSNGACLQECILGGWDDWRN